MDKVQYRLAEILLEWGTDPTYKDLVSQKMQIFFFKNLVYLLIPFALTHSSQCVFRMGRMQHSWLRNEITTTFWNF